MTLQTPGLRDGRWFWTDNPGGWVHSPAEQTVPAEPWVFTHALKGAPWCFSQINHHFELIKWEDSLLSTAQNV